MSLIAKSVIALTAAAAVLTASPASAQRREHVQVGTLDCAVSPSVGLIITSAKALRCRFVKKNGAVEYYRGTVRKIGLDVGVTGGGRLVWAVFAPSGPFRRYALTGNYVGASGEISVIGGIGANALVGGFNKAVALQPVSVQGQVGVNLALGVADMELFRGR